MKNYKFMRYFAGFYSTTDYPEDGGTEYEDFIVKAESPAEAIKAAEKCEEDGWSIDTEYFSEVDREDLRKEPNALHEYCRDDFKEGENG